MTAIRYNMSYCWITILLVIVDEVVFPSFENEKLNFIN